MLGGILSIILLTVPVVLVESTTCTGYSDKNYCTSYAAPGAPEAHAPLPPCASIANGSTVESRFVMLGDYGLSSAICESHVSQLIERFENQWGELDFIFTTGDNNYWDGGCSTFFENVGQYYSRFIGPVGKCSNPTTVNYRQILRRVSADERLARGRYPSSTGRMFPGSVVQSRRANDTRRFFPSLGNHDWDTFSKYAQELPYLQYFEYLGEMKNSQSGGAYYSYMPSKYVELFALNSNLGANPDDPKRMAEHKEMVAWLEKSLKESTALFKFVYFHHPPYSTAQHDPLADWMRLDFEGWGASLVACGHQHVYERIFPHANSTLPYIVNGLGGHPWLYEIHNCQVQAGSRVRYNSKHGALLGLQTREGDQVRIDMCFYSTENGGLLVDEFSMTKNVTRSQSGDDKNVMERVLNDFVRFERAVQ